MLGGASKLAACASLFTRSSCYLTTTTMIQGRAVLWRDVEGMTVHDNASVAIKEGTE